LTFSIDCRGILKIKPTSYIR